MKKLKLNDLKVKSFVTSGDELNVKTVKGGAFTIYPQQGCDSDNHSDCCPITSDCPNNTNGCGGTGGTGGTGGGGGTVTFPRRVCLYTEIEIFCPLIP